MIELDPKIASIIAHLAGVDEAVDEFALDIGVRAESLLESHRETGESSIEVESDGVDAHIYLVDDAAVSIEYGHLTRPGEDAHRVFVPGLRILRNAAGI